MKNKRIRFFLLLVIPGVMACNLIYFPDTSDITYTPSKSNQVLNDGERIGISFDFDVDHYSVEQIFKVKYMGSSVSGSLTWEGNTLYFTPEPSLIRGRKYQMECRGIIQDIQERDYNLNIFVPFYYLSNSETPPLVSSIAPDNGEKVPWDNPITIEFSKAIDTISFNTGFSLSPDTSHTINWNPSNTIATITPQTHWENLTLYAISLSVKVKDTWGIPLNKEYETYFISEQTTQNPVVEQAVPAANDWTGGFPSGAGATLQNDTYYKDVIKIVFSLDMDKDKTSSAFTLTPDLVRQKIWYDSRTFIFIPDEGYEMGVEYTLDIISGAVDVYGNNVLNFTPIRFTAQIAVIDLQRIEIDPVDGEQILPPFSSDIETAITVLIANNYSYTFQFEFSQPFLTDPEKIQVLDNINVACVFPPAAGSPTREGYFWVTDTILDLTYTGFTPKSGNQDYFYMIELKGGKNGIRNDKGGFLTADINQLLRTN